MRIARNSRFIRLTVALAVAVATVVLPQPQPAHGATVTDCNGNNWGGADLTIDGASSMGGQHYNIGTFTVATGITLTVCNVAGGGNGTLTLEAQDISIVGTINGDGRGSAGGGGTTDGVGTAGTAGCNSSIETCGGNSGAGQGGGVDGAGDDAAGGGGGMLGGLDTGGGGGGGYGGAGGVGGTGPQATGGSAGAAYGTSGSTTDQFVQEGSGGGGGGGKGATDTGGTGGAGGARIRLVAAETGSSFTGGGAVNANGGAGSNGTNGDRSAGGGGGGAGGGVYFRAATINFTGTVSVAGGNGGTVGTTANIAETPPSAVTLSGLSATFDADGAAMVRWSTSTELDTVGFHVLRSTSPDGSFERINDGLVLAKRPGGIFGADYTFTDPTGLPRQVYAYKIESWTSRVTPSASTDPSRSVRSVAQ